MSEIFDDDDISNNNILNNDNVIINKYHTRYVAKFKSFVDDYDVKFINIPNTFLDTIDYISEIISIILNKITEGFYAKDRIQLFINHESLSHPISLPFMDVDELEAEMLINYITKVMQSSRVLSLDDKLTFKTSVIQAVHGGSGRRVEFIFKKQSIVRVKVENDQLCALRAIVIGKALADESIDYISIANSRNSIQTRMAYDLAHKIKLDHMKPIGIVELKIIETYLEEYQLYVIDAHCMNSFIYIGPEKAKKIHLYYHDNHYDLIKSLKGFFTSKQFCYECNKAYSSKFEDHPCTGTCKKCKNRLCIDTKEYILCEFCDVKCVNEICYLNHLQKICGKKKNVLNATNF